MEARPGQGKTTTAVQYINHKPGPAIWYQIGEEDCNPLSFLTSIIEVVDHTLSGLVSHYVGESITVGNIDKADIPRTIDKITSRLATLSSPALTFVFDDVHIIKDVPETMHVLDSLLDISPENIHFLLLSRSPIPILSKKVKFGSSTTYLTNENLSFSLHETIELLNILKVKYTSREYAQHLHAVTEGWVMGLILAMDSPNQKLTEVLDLSSSEFDSSSLHHYLQATTLTNLPEELQNDLLKLSLLEEIPSDLAERITGNSEICQHLDRLMMDNHFIKLTDADIETYTFHHLMRESLRAEYSNRFSDVDRLEVLNSAIDHYLSEGLIERVVVYVLRLGVLSEVEKFLENYGLELITKNRLHSLHTIPDELITAYSSESAWLAFLQGILLADSKPEEGVNHLLHSAELFRGKEDKAGRLLALSQLIFHQVLTSIDLENASSFLEEATDIHNQINDTLSVYYQIFICRNLGAGHLVFSGELEKSRHYLGLSLKNAQALKIPNMIVASWVFLGYSYAIPGQFPAARKIAELLYDHILTHEVGASNRAFAHHFLTDMLEMTGDHLNYIRYKQKYSAILEKGFFSRTQMATSVMLWDIKFHFAENKLDRALKLIEESQYLGPLFNTAHIRSRMLEWKALCLALTGERLQEVRSLVADSCRLREDSSWGGFFTVRHYILLGAALSIAGDRSRGEIMLTRGIDASKRLGLLTLEVSGYLLRAYAYLLGGIRQKFIHDLTRGLGLMRFHDYEMFWGWNQSILRHLFKEAVNENIEQSYVKKLCAETFGQEIQENGVLIPSLDIQVLGDFQLSIAEKHIAQSKTFTAKQRSLIALLIASPNMQMSLDKVQNYLWPDVSTGKSRRNLDTLISRLRSLLRPLLLPHDLNNFLVVSHGLVSLKNCRIDAIAFRKIVTKGLKHAGVGEWWQAENFFTTAFSLWNGCFAFDALMDSMAYDDCTDLRSLYLQMAEGWAEFLLKTKQYPEARQLLIKANKMSPSHNRIISLLYRLCICEYDSDNARRTLANYRSALQQRGLTADEIDSLVDSVISSADK